MIREQPCLADRNNKALHCCMTRSSSARAEVATLYSERIIRQSMQNAAFLEFVILRATLVYRYRRYRPVQCDRAGDGNEVAKLCCDTIRRPPPPSYPRRAMPHAPRQTCCELHAPTIFVDHHTRAGGDVDLAMALCNA